MINFLHEFLVDANIEKVWKFYTTLDHLKIITPKKFKLEIIKSDGEKIENDKQVYLSGKVFPFFKSRWRSKITYFDAKEYTYIDEMVEGPFKKWRHIHKFEKIDDNSTRVVDEIEVKFNLSFIDSLLSGYTKNYLKKIFIERETETKKKLEVS